MVFERLLLSDLKKWKVSAKRKPLILHGARQVGKTWILKHFGDTCFEDLAYFNFDEQPDLKSIFRDKNPQRIINELSMFRGKKITNDKTLVFFDEIQECNAALNSLKYFCEQMPEQSIVCAGSLLGVSLQHGMSFPVGKVDHFTLHPLTFREYLNTADKDMCEYLSSITKIEPIPEVFFNRIYSCFCNYLICGGMPLPAQQMVADSDIEAVDYSLQSILRDYQADFAKHAENSVAVRTSYVFNSIPSQLGKENKKFIFQLVRQGARAREYEASIMWLKNAGIAKEVRLCKTPRLPLSAYDDLSAFKIYLLDVGLLRRLSGLHSSVFIDKSASFVEFKGALAENYVLQSLSAKYDVPLRYWTNDRNAEVDFLLQRANDIIPVEVKSGINTRARSLNMYMSSYSPKLALRYSELNLIRQNDIINIPLFMADFTDEIIELAFRD